MICHLGSNTPHAIWRMITTKIKIVADPESPGNVHEINAVSKAGKFSFRFENMPHETNPKTSFLAVLAAIETLRSICEPGLRIGT